MPGLDLVMDFVHVVQSLHVVELQLTLRAWLSILPLGVIPPDMFQQIFVGRKIFPTLFTREFLI